MDQIFITINWNFPKSKILFETTLVGEHAIAIKAINIVCPN